VGAPGPALGAEAHNPPGTDTSDGGGRGMGRAYLVVVWVLVLEGEMAGVVWGWKVQGVRGGGEVEAEDGRVCAHSACRGMVALEGLEGRRGRGGGVGGETVAVGWGERRWGSVGEGILCRNPSVDAGVVLHSLQRKRRPCPPCIYQPFVCTQFYLNPHLRFTSPIEILRFRRMRPPPSGTIC
jgi:hypothetical protein